MPKVIFEKEDKTITCNAGNNLRKLAKKNGIHLYRGIHNLTNCHGHGLCGSCEVEIVEADGIHQRTRMEEVKLNGKPIERRLACQVIVHRDMIVRTHPAKWIAAPPETAEPKTD